MRTIALAWERGRRAGRLLLLLTACCARCARRARSVYVEAPDTDPMLGVLHSVLRFTFPIAFSFFLIRFAFRWVKRSFWLG